MGKKIDLTGMKFGRLTVIEESKERKKDNRVMWRCICSCDKGKEVNVRSWVLISGETKSCGCLISESITKINKRKKTHGKRRNEDGSTNKMYSIWSSMKARCNRKNHKAYKYYGGRGIKVCDEWRNSFEQFYNDMGDCPGGYSIERINNNGNYCKENCMWIPVEKQQRNKTTTKLNETKVIEIKNLIQLGYSNKEIAKLYDVDRVTIYDIRVGRKWKGIK